MDRGDGETMNRNECFWESTPKRALRMGEEITG